MTELNCCVNAPDEDSFRKLTVAELREEQSESIAEAEGGPTMEM
jgi:hypothetical protein